ncbi:MAG: hypothetical protein ACR2N6_01635 [Miltoncostaeaceae bacterium]
MRRLVIYRLWLAAAPASAGLKTVGGCLILLPIAAALLVAATLAVLDLRTRRAEAPG